MKTEEIPKSEAASATSAVDASMPEVSTSGLADVIFIRIPYVLTGTLLLSAIAINFANVIARYFFSQALYWAEEVLIYMVMWGVVLAAATITYQGLHIKMDLFSSMLRSPAKEILGAFSALLMICGAGYVVLQSYTVVGLLFNSGQESIIAGIPLPIPHLAVPVGFGLIALATLIRLRSYISGRFE